MTAIQTRRAFPFLALCAAAAFSMGADRCDDPPDPGACTVNGRVYANGDGGVPAPDGCNTCTCVDGEVTSCTEIACPPGSAACTVGGVTYAHGSAGVPAPDGCNTCTCEDGALTSCTEIACPGPTCSVFGQSYSGAVPMPDGCNTCECADGAIGEVCTFAACGPIPIVDCEELAPFEGDAFDLGSVSVTEDTLSVQVSYSGGCAPHYFRLCYEPYFLESEPVQSTLRLQHDAQGDPCEAYPTETREFDLTPLREAWRAAYGGESGTIILRLGEGATYSF
jgi:hypothetical protein